MSDEEVGFVDEPIEDSHEVESVDEGYEASEDSYEEGSSEQLESDIQDAIDDGATKEEIQQMIKEFTYKANGREITETIDLNDKEAIIKKLQLAAAARPAMQDKAEIEKLYRSQITDWKNNPWKFFEDLGMDPDEVVSMRVEEQLKEMEKTPEQRERDQMRRELEEARRREAQREEELKNYRQELLLEEARQELDEEITAALDAHASLPATERVIQQIADTLYWAYENADELDINPDDLKVEDVLPSVEASLKKEFNDLINALGDDALDAFLGQRTLDRLRNKRVKQAKRVPSVSSIKQQEVAKVQPKEEVKEKNKMSLEDFMRQR